MAPELVTEFPQEWVDGHTWVVAEVVMTGTLPNRQSFAIGGGVLDGGANLMALVWQDGQRVLRASPDTGWSMEERFLGTQPEADSPEGRAIARLWQIACDAQVRAGREVAEEMGGYPGRRS